MSHGSQTDNRTVYFAFFTDTIVSLEGGIEMKVSA